MAFKLSDARRARQEAKAAAAAKEDDPELPVPEFADTVAWGQIKALLGGVQISTDLMLHHSQAAVARVIRHALVAVDPERPTGEEVVAAIRALPPGLLGRPADMYHWDLRHRLLPILDATSLAPLCADIDVEDDE